MNIVGIDIPDREEAQVHTIDIWFSQKRGAWAVERLNADGHLIGAAFHCEHEDDAVACLAEWLRAHGETHLASPRQLVRRTAKAKASARAAEASKAKSPPKRRAA